MSGKHETSNGCHFANSTQNFENNCFVALQKKSHLLSVFGWYGRSEREKLILYPSDKEEHNKQPKIHDYNDKDVNWNGNNKNR